MEWCKMEFEISKDMKLIRELLNITQYELSKEIGVKILTIQRIENQITMPSKSTLSNFYNFVYTKKIYLNKIKEMFYLEGRNNSKLLFHGSKSGIFGNIDLKKSRLSNDFGQGFYCGESYEQSAMFIENFEDSKIYYYYFDNEGLNYEKYNVGLDWMLTIAYFRGGLKRYSDHPVIKNIISKLNGLDYVVAPIADNKMFRIIDAFINGEITDEQCMHCLAATNLGNQYVLLTDKAISRLSKLECCYFSTLERRKYRTMKLVDDKISEDKVKLARIQFRGKGYKTAYLKL